MEIKPRLGDGILDQTLLESDGKQLSMMAALLADIFLRDSIYWLTAFMLTFILVTTDVSLAQVLQHEKLLKGLVFGVLALFALVAAVFILLTRRYRTSAFACLLTCVMVAGLWHTLVTGSTVFARICLVQWLMSFGTVIVAYRSNYRPTSGFGGIVMPELIAALCITSLVAWGAGVLSEPNLPDALCVLLPIVPCVIYRYYWVVYGFIATQAYCADETILAWSAFYTDLFGMCKRVPLSAKAPIHDDDQHEEK